MTRLLRLLREPLVHFLLAGAALFTLFALVRGPEAAPEDESVIVVDRRALLTFMQYRANAFEPGLFSAALDSMTEAERAALIDAYVKEEALHREAVALGLDESDYIIRQRMIQKMEFLLGDVADAGLEAEEAELEAYFAENREAYAIAPSVTFTHVFFDTERRGAEAARADAEAMIAELNGLEAGFNDSPGRGDRFPFLRNYVERTYDYVASHFGTEFAAALADVPAGEGWAGPLSSAYGVHAVLVTRRTARRLPALDEVREDVERDFRRARSDAALAEMTDAIRARYAVEVRDLAPAPAADE